MKLNLKLNTANLSKFRFSGVWHLITGLMRPDIRKTLISQAAHTVSQFHSQNILRYLLATFRSSGQF